MRSKLLSLVAGGLATACGWAAWSSTATAQEPRTPVVPVQAAIGTDSGSVPVQFVDHRRNRGWRGGRSWDVNIGVGSPYYGSGYYSYPRYRYYSYPRYYYPNGGYYTSYYDPYYYPSSGVYFTW